MPNWSEYMWNNDIVDYGLGWNERKAVKSLASRPNKYITKNSNPDDLGQLWNSIKWIVNYSINTGKDVLHTAWEIWQAPIKIWNTLLKTLSKAIWWTDNTNNHKWQKVTNYNWHNTKNGWKKVTNIDSSTLEKNSNQKIENNKNNNKEIKNEKPAWKTYVNTNNYKLVDDTNFTTDRINIDNTTSKQEKDISNDNQTTETTKNSVVLTNNNNTKSIKDHIEEDNEKISKIAKSTRLKDNKKDYKINFNPQENIYENIINKSKNINDLDTEQAKNARDNDNLSEQRNEKSNADNIVENNKEIKNEKAIDNNKEYSVASLEDILKNLHKKKPEYKLYTNLDKKIKEEFNKLNKSKNTADKRQVKQNIKTILNNIKQKIKEEREKDKKKKEKLESLVDVFNWNKILSQKEYDRLKDLAIWKENISNLDKNALIKVKNLLEKQLKNYFSRKEVSEASKDRVKFLTDKSIEKINKQLKKIEKKEISEWVKLITI